MFPMSPLQSWSFLLLVVVGIICAVALFHEVDNWLIRRALAAEESTTADDAMAADAAEPIYDWAVQGL